MRVVHSTLKQQILIFIPIFKPLFYLMVFIIVVVLLIFFSDAFWLSICNVILLGFTRILLIASYHRSQWDDRGLGGVEMK